MIGSAVLDTCNALDGVEDRLLENPLSCNFDIATLACTGSTTNSSTCLTQEQIEAVTAVYAGPKDGRDGHELYPGFFFGSEIEWILQEQTLSDLFSIPILQNLVFDNLNYDDMSFNWSSDVDTLDQRAGRYIDAISPNLSDFKNAGGKLLVTQGTYPFHAK